MEVLSSFDGLDEGDWISPRISFSQDSQFPGRYSPKMQLKDTPEEEFSFMFHNSANADLPADESMLSAEELFINGKVRPLQEDANLRDGAGCLVEGDVRFERSIQEKPRCFSVRIESCREDTCAGSTCVGRAYMSLHNSRCSSPSRVMSMPHTTPTSPKSSSLLPSPSASLSSEITSSPALSAWTVPSPSLTLSEMPSSTSMPSSKYSNKLKDFFKLKKGNMSKDAAISTLPFTSTSAEISRESAQSSGSTSCRLPSKSFWPFSRSNSAGESKTTPVVLPPPRRSNSAGEGKTTSSSLLPMNVPPSKKLTHSSTNVRVKGMPTSSDTMSKKGLPPLPSSNAKRANSFFVPVHCGTDSVALSSQSIPVQACSLSNRSNEAEAFIESLRISPACAREAAVHSDDRNSSGDIQHVADTRVVSRKGRSSSSASPGRPVRRGVHGNSARNFVRGSPGRRGVWNSPGRGNAGRVSIRYLDRGSFSSKGHVRPKDMLSRDAASVRISPVLNMAVPSLRGTKASSRSKIFGLGSLFSKKDNATSLRPPSIVLPLAESQNGA